MKEELHQRIQALLDAGGGLAPDEELARALEDAGEEAHAEAEALAEVDAGLRAFAVVDLSDDAGEALATRIEQRLDEELARIADPVAPPIFADKDGQPPKKEAPKVGKPKTSTGDYSLANLTSLSVKNAPVVEPDAPLKRPPQRPVEKDPEIVHADDVGLEELADSAPPPKPPPAPREPLKLSDERASIPTVAPFDLGGTADVHDLPPPPVDLEEVRRRRRVLFYWGSGLAAAAALLVVAVTGISTMGSDAEPMAASSVAQMEAAEPSLTGAAEAPAPSPPGESYDRSVAADEVATVMEPLAELAPAEEAEAEAEPEAPAATDPADQADAITTSMARPRGSSAPEREGRARRRRSAMAAPPVMASAGSGMSTPSREDVVRAMRAIQPQVAACGSGGIVNVNVTVGGSGRVRNAVIEGQYAGTREGSCVARAVRRARLPAFARDSFSFRYPFRL